MTLSAAIRRLRQVVRTKRARREFLYLLAIKWRGIDLSYVPLEELETSKARSNWYSNSGGPDLEVVLRLLPISEGDVALDIGCGKGGAIITMAKFPFARVDGVEISPQLVNIARKNLYRVGLKNTSIFCCDAADFTDLDPYTYFYMYNPFPETVMSIVLDNILRSLERRRRKVTLIYKNPLGHGLLSRAGFSRTNQFHHSECPFFVYVI